eukprot:gene5263-7313_t
MLEEWWVPDEVDVWTRASQSGPELPNGCINFLILKNQKHIAFPKDKCLIASRNHNAAPEDLVFLQEVNQATILSCTRLRFEASKIYTNLGLVLMSVNPFQNIPGLYGFDMIDQYRNPMSLHSLPAHVYLIPSRAYNNMCRTGKNQSILISGESGAGKTEATKQCLNFLTVVADTLEEDQLIKRASLCERRDSHDSVNSEISALSDISSIRRKSSTVTVHHASDIANRIIAASPILEAFGNAKTTRNPNSSRFGKWMVLNFNDNNILQSSTITSYLLEKSRITQRDPRERNYHIFYQLIRGLEPSKLKVWNLPTESFKYRYLLQDTLKEAPNLNDSKLFYDTYNAFLAMGFSENETMNVLKVVGAVLLLGNIKFLPINDGEGTSIKNQDVVDSISTMLGVKPAILAFSLINRSIESGKGRHKSIITITLNNQKAMENRDSLARSLYDRLFQDIIATINIHSQRHVQNVDLNSDSSRSIGLLDIFGFEIFVENSFEQLCINYCNEILQNQFNFVIFTAEKNLYLQEEIDCDTIEFRDNSDVIKEIDSLFKSLDEEGRIPKGTSKTWYDKSKRAHQNSKSPHILYSNRKDTFLIKHYAGDVEYIPTGFLEKNVESLNNDLLATLSGSSDALVSRIFNPTPVAETASTNEFASPMSLKSPSNNTSSPMNRSNTLIHGNNNNHNNNTNSPAASNAGSNISRSISWRFNNQLTSLMKMLKQTESHFIRCIKSNEACAPQTFEAVIVHKQLVYSGVFEVVKIQLSGLPCRLLHHLFVDRFRCLLPSKLRYSVISSQDLLDHLKLNCHPPYALPHAQIGLTMTFISGSEQRLLEYNRDTLFQKSAVLIQSWIRKRIYSSIYTNLLPYTREFKHHLLEFDLDKTKEIYKSIEVHVLHYQRATNSRILAEYSQRLIDDINSIHQRVELINDAKHQITIRSVESINKLSAIVLRGIELNLTHHKLINECNMMVNNYYKALEFCNYLDMSNNSLLNMSLDNITSGITLLESYKDIISNADTYINKCLKHKKMVQDEIEQLLVPLNFSFMNNLIRYEPTSGMIIPCDINRTKSQPFLRDLIKSCTTFEFISLDVQGLYFDCTNFCILLDDYLPSLDAVGTLDFINKCKQETKNKLFLGQLDEFEKWAELQMSVIKLKAAFGNNCIPSYEYMTSSVTTVDNIVRAEEVRVDCSDIEESLGILGMLVSPLPAVQTVLKVGAWILKIRRAYLSADWESLEKFVVEADEDGVQNRIFDEYPECIDELNSCQWQVIYHGLTADVLFVLSEPVFGVMSIADDDLVDVVADISENMILLEALKGFADSSSPKLLILVPLFESILQLRSIAYKKDTKSSRQLMEVIMKQNAEAISIHNLELLLKEEFQMAERLIRKIELEEELKKVILQNEVIRYPHNASNDQPNYSSFCNCIISQQLLNNVLDELQSLRKKNITKHLKTNHDNNSHNKINPIANHNNNNIHDIDEEEYSELLEDRILLAKSILFGRKHILLSEFDPIISSWKDILSKYKSLFSKAYIDAFASETIELEHQRVIQELSRRILLIDLQKIIITTNIKGEVDINIHVIESELFDNFVLFNELSTMMTEGLDFLSYPNNIQALHGYCGLILKLRRAVLESNWISIPIIMERLETIEHGGGKEFLNIKNELLLVQSEVNARNAIEKMRYALENIADNVIHPSENQHDDDMTHNNNNNNNFHDHNNSSNSIVTVKRNENEQINSLLKIEIDHNKSNVPNLLNITPLRTAMANIKEYKGSKTIQLYELGSLISTVLEVLLPGSAMLDHEKVETIENKYMEYDLNPSSMMKTIEFIRVHSFLRNLCFLLQSQRVKDDVEYIKRGLVNLKKSFSNVFPEQFIPWMKSAYLYCEALATYQSVDAVFGINHANGQVDTTYTQTSHTPSNSNNNNNNNNNNKLSQIFSLAIDTNSSRLSATTPRRGLSIASTTNNNNRLPLEYSKYWVKIIEITQQLDEIIEFLRHRKINENDVTYEQSYLGMLTEKKVYGYRRALEIKAMDDENARQVQHLETPVEELLKMKFREEDAQNPYGITQLRAAGYHDDAILKIKFPAKLLWAFDVKPELLRKYNYSVRTLRNGGYTLASLYNAGYNIEKLKSAGFTIAELRSIGITMEQLRLAGFHEKDLLTHGMSIEHLKTSDLDIQSLLNLGLTTKELLAAGYSIRDLFLHGFTAVQLYNAGITNPKELYENGYDLNRLKAAGFNIYDFRDAGFGFDILLNKLCFSDICLYNAGFDYELEQEVLLTLYNSCNGPNWKLKTNWCSSSIPMKEWYGITVEQDRHGYDRIVGIDLNNNNLIGNIPERIWALSKLKKIFLNNNKLSGIITKPVIKRFQINNIEYDLSNNKQLIIPNELKYDKNDGIMNESVLNSSNEEKKQSISPTIGIIPPPSGTNASHISIITAFDNLFDNNNNSNNNNNFNNNNISSNESYDAFHNEYDDTERLALIDLFNSTNGSQWKNNNNWNTFQPISTWYGITTNKYGRVIKINLSSNHLYGSLNDSLSSIDNLIELDLRFNQLFGSIPLSLAHCYQLEKIYLHANKLSGSIPTSLSKLKELKVLDLRSNQLIDEVPKNLNSLTKLQYLGLRSNRLKINEEEIKEMLPMCKKVY